MVSLVFVNRRARTLRSAKRLENILNENNAREKHLFDFDSRTKMNTRRKRHRRSWKKPYNRSPSNCEIIIVKYRVETLPPEVLEMIFRYLPLGDVANSIRLVSRQFSTIATAVLNAAFLAAGTRLEATMRYIESTRMSRATPDSDLLIWSRAFNVLELIKAQYKMLKAVTWRYTHPPKSANFNRICFYAGSLLDELNVILDLARKQPAALSTLSSSAPNNNRAGGVAGWEEAAASSLTSPRLVSFVALCKRFMNYFEKVSECKVNRSALISGCKAIDVLDCLAVGREVTGFRISSDRKRGARSSGETSSVENFASSTGEYGKIDRSNGGSIVTMGLRYVMRRAWFTCLQVPCAPDENSWREDQRFMYLRLRRLVGSVNEHHYEKSHFERDLLLRTTRVIALEGERRALRLPDSHPPRPPPASTYSGYGVYAGRFFYYGNMNKYAYESKFKDLGGEAGASSDEESGQDDEGIDDEDEESENRNVVSSRRGPPAFDLVVRVELRCSSDLAPLAVISSLRRNELDDQSPRIQRSGNIDRRNSPISSSDICHQDNPELYFKLNITCPASAANRLPGNFTWEQRGPAHSRRKRSEQQHRLSD